MNIEEICINSHHRINAAIFLKTQSKKNNVYLKCDRAA